MRSTGKLSKGFVLAKPIAQENYDESVIYELERQGRLRITRKRDGWKILAITGAKHTVRLYTDGLNEIDSRLDHIKQEIMSFGFPPQTLFVGEVIMFDERGHDDLGKVISLFHSKKDRAIKLQKECKASFIVFGIIKFNRDPREPKPCIDWFGTMSSRWIWAYTHRERGDDVFPVNFLETTFDEAKKMVVEEGWEGLVLYDKDYQLTYRTDGKAPKRPEGCYKWKPILEDDFIVREWIPRSDGTVKELVLLQIDPVTGLEFYCGKLGSFSNEMRKNLAKPSYPIVVQAKFEARFPKTGKIRNARFMRVRDDKPVEQCLAPKSYLAK